MREVGDKTANVSELKSSSTEQWNEWPTESRKHVTGSMEVAIDGLDYSQAEGHNEKA